MLYRVVPGVLNRRYENVKDESKRQRVMRDSNLRSRNSRRWNRENKGGIGVMVSFIVLCVNRPCDKRRGRIRRLDGTVHCPRVIYAQLSMKLCSSGSNKKIGDGLTVELLLTEKNQLSISLALWIVSFNT